MVYITLGVLGFLFGCASETARVQKVSWAKPLLAAAAYALLAYSLAMVVADGPRFWLPPWLPILGAGLASLAALLLLYSLFLELPFQSTYVGRGPRPSLVTTGTYALVRHPTVLWYGLLLVSVLLLTRSVLLLVALPVWLALDVLWAALLERSLLRRFSGYQAFRQTTPMLVPNLESLRACLATIRSSRSAKAGVSRG